MKLEVLVTTMHQTDMALVEQMRLQCDAVIANQCGRWGFSEEQREWGAVRMLSSDTIGVGTNRNLALQLAQGEILLCADDDITYYDGAMQGVLDAFKEFPDADVIFFGLDMTRNGEIYERRRHPKKRLHLWNSLRFGAARMAIRRTAVERYRLSFSPLFGGGGIYGSGEDTLFTRDCFRCGLHVYSHSHVLGTCAKDSSSWFTGFNRKYMFDKGAWIACAFPGTKHLIKWYFIWRFRNKTELSLKEMIRHINLGIHAFPKGICYQDAANAADQ